MSAFREIGYGAMMLLCAMTGMAAGMELRLIGGQPPILDAAVGAIVGGSAWMAYKYLRLMPPKS